MPVPGDRPRATRFGRFDVLLFFAVLMTVIWDIRTQNRETFLQYFKVLPCWRVLDAVLIILDPKTMFGMHAFLFRVPLQAAGVNCVFSFNVTCLI